MKNPNGDTLPAAIDRSGICIGGTCRQCNPADTRLSCDSGFLGSPRRCAAPSKRKRKEIRERKEEKKKRIERSETKRDKETNERKKREKKRKRNK